MQQPIIPNLFQDCCDESSFVNQIVLGNGQDETLDVLKNQPRLRTRRHQPGNLIGEGLVPGPTPQCDLIVIYTGVCKKNTSLTSSVLSKSLAVGAALGTASQSRRSGLATGN